MSDKEQYFEIKSNSATSLFLDSIVISPSVLNQSSSASIEASKFIRSRTLSSYAFGS